LTLPSPAASWSVFAASSLTTKNALRCSPFAAAHELNFSS
jgi:hypothetical protein